MAIRAAALLAAALATIMTAGLAAGLLLANADSGPAAAWARVVRETELALRAVPARVALLIGELPADVAS